MLKIRNHIVSVEWLMEHLNDDNLIVFDGTIKKVTANSESQVKPVYIKNAMIFDIKNDFSNSEAPFPNTMISPDTFRLKARELGVNTNSCIIVYDQYGYYSCARVWWMFKTMGFDNIAILDGGLPSWLDSNLPIQKSPSTSQVHGDFVVDYNRNMIHNHLPVLEAIHNEKIEIIDARAYNRFLGTEPEPRKGLRSGHIPSSSSIPYLSLLTDNKMKSKEELITIFKEIKDKEVIFSCGSGITACILALGAEIAGISNKSVYDGSWTEWGSLVKLPIEK